MGTVGADRGRGPDEVGNLAAELNLFRGGVHGTLPFVDANASGTIEQVLSRYSGRWLALEIVRHDPPALEPQEVRVVAVTDDEQSARKVTDPAPLRRFVVYAPTPEERDIIEVVQAS